MKALTCAGTILALLIAFPCRGQEPISGDKGDNIAELRREVLELRELVNELMKKLEAMEYGRIPRIEHSQPQPQVYRPVAAPLEPRSKLRFPFDTERGSAAPTPRNTQLQISPFR